MLTGIFLPTAIALLAYGFYKWAVSNHNYFEKRKVKYMKPKFLVGNTGGFFLNRYSAVDFAQLLYNAFPSERYVKHFIFFLNSLNFK